MGLGPVGFDLDMTLIDSRPAIMASFEATSRDMSAGIDLDAVNGRLGVKLEDELAYVNRIRSVTAVQVRAVARRYLDPARYTRLALLPPGGAR